MGDIYIILYHEFVLTNCYHTYEEVNYFTNKDEAIKYLESKGYKHIYDDKYQLSHDTQAEILGLVKYKGWLNDIKIRSNTDFRIYTRRVQEVPIMSNEPMTLEDLVYYWRDKSDSDLLNRDLDSFKESYRTYLFYKDQAEQFDEEIYKEWERVLEENG